MLFKNNIANKDYLFQLNDHVTYNRESDSWRELPVYKENQEDMLPGNLFSILLGFKRQYKIVSIQVMLFSK